MASVWKEATALHSFQSIVVMILSESSVIKYQSFVLAKGVKK